MRTSFKLGLTFGLLFTIATTFLLITSSKAGPVYLDKRARSLLPIIEKLRPLHTRLGKPKTGEWLSQHKEPGQTFKHYLAAKPVKPTRSRKTIYILPIGNFTKDQRKVLTLTAEFMGLFYSVPVTVMTDLDDKTIPAKARRVHPTWGDKQFLSTYILDDVLRKKLPKDGSVILGLTATDLWPGRGWNFVFGQASTRARVGVWSIYRNGDPAKGDDGLRTCLQRTLKTAVHETGHMFTIRHCTAYECGMCGSNSRPESDARPMAFCPECMAKVCWATKAAPLPRMKALAAFCKKHGLKKEQERYDTQIKALDPPK